jgi:hypothetical protein
LFSQALIVGTGENSEQISNLDAKGFNLTIKVNQVHFLKIKHKHDFYYLAQIPGFAKGLKIGNPQLPVYRKLIEIPDGASWEIKVKKMHFRIYNLRDYSISYPLFPAQEPVEKVERPNIVFRKNDDVYKKDAFYSERLFHIEALGEMRGRHIGRLSIAPVEYNPVKNQLKIYDELELEIVFKFPQTIVKPEQSQVYEPAFMQMQNYLLNGKAYATATPIMGVQYPLKMVIVADTVFKNALKPFIEWKEQQGYKIIEAYTADTAVGHTNTSIKNYLQNLYNAATPLNPAPSYVLFVGDVNQIPKYSGQLGNWPADLYYCEFTNDYFPEMMYGRFSANDTSELNPQIEKTIAYEKYLISNPTYLDTSILISGKDPSYASTYGDGQINYGTTYYFNAANNIYCRNYLYVNQSYLHDAEIRHYADTGAAFINYTAHGLATGWKDPAFKVNNVADMKNKGKYPLMVGNACLTNKFDYSTCFGEALLRARDKGAIGYIGASDNTLWDEDFYWAVGYGNISSFPSYQSTTDGLYDLIFHTHNEPHNQWALTAYQYLQAGNMAVTQGGSNVRRYWELYHLMGDPTLMPYLHVPTQITAQYNPLLPLGLNNFSVITDAYALVALSHNDTLIASALADSNGLATLYFPPFTQAKTLKLVITGSQKQPYFSSINTGSPNYPYLIYESHQVIDSSENNNGLADYTEHIKLDMNIVNITGHRADSCFAHLRTADPSVNIVDSVYYLGTFPANDTLSFDSIFSFDVTANVQDGHNVKFYVFINDSTGRHWLSHFYIRMHAPELTIGKVIIDDTQSGGNSNGRIDPGETVYMRIPLKNEGSLFADDVHCLISTNYSGVSISSGSYIIDTVAVDSTRLAEYEITVAQNYKTGDVIRFDFSFDTHGRTGQEVLSQLIGFVGEDFETGDLSKFTWITESSKPWIIQKDYVYDGQYAAASHKPLNDNDTSSLYVTMNILEDDSISYYQRISCEFDYDFLYFYIDNLVQGRWSGNINWQRKSFPVSKGIHTFKWSYIKDSYSFDYLDAVFVDDIAFPPTDAWTTVQNAEEQLQSLKLMPNPAQAFTVLSFDVANSGTVDILLYDNKGQLIKNLQSGLRLYEGAQQIRIDTQDLPSGIYFISIRSAKGSWYKKLIVL